MRGWAVRGWSAALAAPLLGQRGHLFPWAAVAFGAGIGLYFALPVEPSDGWRFGAAAGAAILGLCALRLGPALGPLALGLALGLAGFGLAAARAHDVAAPVLGFRYYGPVEGRIIAVDRSSSDALRLTLDRVVLARMDPARMPAQVRVSLQGDQHWLDPTPGGRVILTGHLAPPSGPVEPGDFDFRRHAWFEGLGAVGYTRNPALMLEPAPGGAGLWIDRTRMRLSGALRAAVAGDPGGLAAAVMTGDRSGLSRAGSDAMRDANLYHLVSISGMHMAMLVAIIFGLVRGVVALVPPLALRLSGKKIAACAALPAAAFYLALAGRDVATERAFVMAAVMLGAILQDRQALTLRAVALAALAVLALRPESLLNAGFQMSFAAVVALVAGFQALREGPGTGLGRWRWLAPALMLGFSSLLAGMATAPFAAAHFNRVAHYGLIANLLAAPAMGLAMAAALALAVLGPLGAGEPARLIVDWSCRWILWVSERIATTAGAVSAAPAPPWHVLPVMALAALFIILWRGGWRWLGLAPLALAFASWGLTPRPDLLISASGGAVGVMTASGRALNRDSGEAHVITAWRENDGRLNPSTGEGFSIQGRRAEMTLAGLRILAIRGAREAAATEGCDGADILISTEDLPGRRPCQVFDPARLRQTGAVAGHVRDGALRLTTAAEAAGRRLWTGQ